MKYVKLTHRLFVPDNTFAIEFVDFESDDEMFDKCANVLLEENERRHEEKINKLESKLMIIQARRDQTESERNELVRRTPFFLRLGSKLYRHEIEKLNLQLSDHRYQHALHLRGINEMRENLEARVFEDYSALKRLLKEMGYSLTSELQKGNSSITVEVWQKE